VRYLFNKFMPNNQVANKSINQLSKTSENIAHIITSMQSTLHEDSKKCSFAFFGIFYKSI
jgi:hypothetical protein